MKLLSLLVLSGFSSGALAEDGYVGIRYQEQAEGYVVTEVAQGMAAAGAGMVVGDLIVTVDGQEIGPDVQIAPLRGPVGKPVVLGVVAPLGDEVRSVTLERGRKVAAPRIGPKSGKHYLRMTGSLRRGTVRDARTAAKALVAADFDGMVPEMAFASLRRAARVSPRKARAVLKVLTDEAANNPRLNRIIGLTYRWLGDPQNAVLYLRAARAADGASLADRLGGNAWADRELASAMWDAGDRSGSIELTRSIAPLMKTQNLWKKTGMATPTPTQAWAVATEPLDDIELELLDGTAWSLSEHAGKPVAVVFWASWCGPCKKELPALAELVRKRPNWPVEFVAVSVDKDAHLPKAQAMVENWKLPFPVSHSRSLGEQMGVTTLPAIRLIGPYGVLRSSSSGYSKKSVQKLEKAMDQLVREKKRVQPTVLERPFADAWSTGQIQPRAVTAAYGFRHIAVGVDGRVTGIVEDHGAMELPVENGAVVGGTVVDEGLVSAGDKHVAWFDGPVSAGKWWIRSRDEVGTTRWFRTMSSPIRAVVTSGDQLWVATDEGMTVFDADGRVLFSVEQGARDLASAPDGGVWAVDGERRVRCAPDGQVVLSDAAMGSELITSDGSWVGAGFKQLAMGRFGPDGQPRVIALRDDGTVVSLDGDGKPAARIDVQNERGHSVAVGDLDGDGRDELLLSSFGHGVATIELEIP